MTFGAWCVFAVVVGGPLAYIWSARARGVYVLSEHAQKAVVLVPLACVGLVVVGWVLAGGPRGGLAGQLAAVPLWLAGGDWWPVKVLAIKVVVVVVGALAGLVVFGSFGNAR